MIIEPTIDEAQKNADASKDDDDVDTDELNFNEPSTKRKRAKIAWIFQKQLENEFVVDYKIKQKVMMLIDALKFFTNANSNLVRCKSISKIDSYYHSEL
ncbi:hypothetical protein BpHYR1_012776 [Brachionus plicatilis]|uniref:Uncharacterized protein n=1 Tax=Brachionus plicatilis TaxID=10195 RepID=A0A3M7STN8_BRAPC|nr:hypothetical protein BpHYR1_012776 [Brachionus plicatilis]